ncbi:MAG: RND transporter [Pirellulaceae bacterium]|nr:RND transporter [Pirellulaceae bacterium]
MSVFLKSSWNNYRASVAFALVFTIAFGVAGCNKSDSASGSTSASSAKKADLSHGGWWCVEHGVPESECARCDKSLVAKFKESGDWCKEHDRPESQCFICGPKRFEKFAATYEAKTGSKPPKPTE